MAETRELRDGEALEVGDIVCLGSYAFSTAIVLEVHGDDIVVERPHMRASQTTANGKGIGATLYERFTTNRRGLRVYVTGPSGEIDNRLLMPV